MATWRQKSDEEMDLPPLIPPQMSKLKFDYPAGSTIIVRTTDMGSFRGQVFQNPAETGITNCVTLINVTHEDSNRTLSGHHTFFQHEVSTVAGVEAPSRKMPKPKEIVMDTVVVTSADKLNQLVKSIDKEDEIGCYVPGVSMGRFGSPVLVLMNIRDVLTVIPLEDLPDEERDKTWEILCSQVFESRKIHKIFFDSRGIIDYLFQRKKRLHRCFDLRFLELSLTSNGKFPPEDPTHYENSINLTDMLKNYLSSQVPPCDLEILSSPPFENGSVSIVGTKEKKYCALKVKYLRLLKAELMQRLFYPSEQASKENQRRLIATENIVAFKKS